MFKVFVGYPSYEESCDRRGVVGRYRQGGNRSQRWAPTVLALREIVRRVPLKARGITRPIWFGGRGEQEPGKLGLRPKTAMARRRRKSSSVW
jgi:hypothetical protein